MSDYVFQAGLELLVSSDSPVSSPWVPRTTGLCHHTYMSSYFKTLYIEAKQKLSGNGSQPVGHNPLGVKQSFHRGHISDIPNIRYLHYNP